LKDDNYTWHKCLEAILRYLKNGSVDGGFRGELVCKIILMATWDSCQSELLHQSISVKDFLSQLGGDDMLEAVKNNKCQMGETDRFLNGKVYFTHFTYVSYSLTTEADLMSFCRNGQAIFCKSGQKLIDLLIPVVLDTHLTTPRFTFIAVQCKNHLSFGTDGHKKAEKAYSAENAGFMSWDLPYLVLFMSIGAFNLPKKEKNIQSLINVKDIEIWNGEHFFVICKIS
jgi:hypothetical protein